MSKTMYAMKFDDLRRKMLVQEKPKDLHKLTTAIEGTPEFDTYMGLYLMPENTAIHMEVEDDNKTYTFYTINEVLPPRPQKEETVQEEIVKPTFEIIAELVRNETEAGIQTLTHVKLSKPHIARLTGKGEYVEVEYVLVGAVVLNKKDAHGEFKYEETAVTASDADATSHEAFLFLAQRALTVEEAMFSIGEV